MAQHFPTQSEYTASRGCLIIHNLLGEQSLTELGNGYAVYK